jgi:hypothetical protein
MVVSVLYAQQERHGAQVLSGNRDRRNSSERNQEKQKCKASLWAN